MDGSLAKLNNRQVAIIVQDGQRNQAVASALMARRARIGRNRTKNRDDSRL